MDEKRLVRQNNDFTIVLRPGIKRIDVSRKNDCLFCYRNKITEVTGKRKYQMWYISVRIL